MKLIEPSIEYKEQLIEYIEEHERYNSPMNGSGGLYRYKDNIEAYLAKLEQDKQANQNKNLVPQISYMLIREEDNYLIGMINIRLKLNDNLKRCGGHIGYGIRPSERRKGYNKINLYLGLQKCYEYGIEYALLDCEESNIASYKSMEALGGICLSKYIDKEHGLCRKYQIDVSKSLLEHQNLVHQKQPKYSK